MITSKNIRESTHGTNAYDSGAKYHMIHITSHQAGTGYTERWTCSRIEIKKKRKGVQLKYEKTGKAPNFMALFLYIIEKVNDISLPGLGVKRLKLQNASPVQCGLFDLFNFQDIRAHGFHLEASRNTKTWGASRHCRSCRMLLAYCVVTVSSSLSQEFVSSSKYCTEEADALADSELYGMSMLSSMVPSMDEVSFPKDV